MAAPQHKRNLSLHYSAIAFIVLVIFGILSVTVFFNIDTVYVIGSSVYSAEEIIGASGIHGGDNMIRKNLGKAESVITEQLIYIEEAKISRKLPSSVEIVVTPCTETASLEAEEGFIVVSGEGKILRFSDAPAEDTKIFYGADPAEDLEAGGTFASAEDAKTKVIYELMKRADSGLTDSINEFDVTDRLSIKCVFDGRIDIELGAVSDIDYKLRFAREIITGKLPHNAEGRLRMLDTGAQFLSRSDLEQIEQTYQYNSERSLDIVPAETAPPAEETVKSSETTKLRFE